MIFRRINLTNNSLNFIHCFKNYKMMNRFNSTKLKSKLEKENWQSVVGLEVHAQIDTCSKLFSSGCVQYDAPVNSQVQLLDAAIPGTLPVLNLKCVEAAVLTSLALSCNINEVSYFDRKHYFYADLPAGYQITQQRKAIANDGHLSFIVYNQVNHKEPYYSKVRVKQVQLEHDSGKSLHDSQLSMSLIDLNRSGTPLMEIVFEPEIKNGEEAGALVKELALILSSLGTCNAKMELGSLRVDANVSVNRVGEKMGTRTEVKNLNSIRSLVNAIDYEIQRQIEVIVNGGEIINETRSYDVQLKETLPMRDKEVKQDYRFMPEPNLPPLRLSFKPSIESDPNLVSVLDLQSQLKELPDVHRKRLIKKYGIRLDVAMFIVGTEGMLKFFESVMEFLKLECSKAAAHFLKTIGLSVMYEHHTTYTHTNVPPKIFAEIIDLYYNGMINLASSKQILKLKFQGDNRTPQQIMIENKLNQVVDDESIDKICLEIINENPKVISKYKVTKHIKHINKLMGEIRKRTKGLFDMDKTEQRLKEILEK